MSLKNKLISWLGGTPKREPVDSAIMSLPGDDPIARLIRARAEQGQHGPIQFLKDSPEGKRLLEMLTGGVSRPPPQTPEQAKARALLSDEGGDYVDWRQWSIDSRLLTENLPGWSACRFFHRVSEHKAVGVFGAVKGDFGIWRMPFRCCDYDADELDEETTLPTLTYLPVGMDIGLFDGVETASMAAMLVERQDWSHLPAPDEAPGAREAWNAHMASIRRIWEFNGIVYSDRKHAHDEATGHPIGIMVCGTATEGKPEKLS